MEYAAIVCVALAALALQEYRSRRHEEQVVRLAEGFQRERRELLNRIQAPEAASYVADSEPSDAPLWVDPLSDAAHEDYVTARANGEAE